METGHTKHSRGTDRRIKNSIERLNVIIVNITEEIQKTMFNIYQNQQQSQA